MHKPQSTTHFGINCLAIFFYGCLAIFCFLNDQHINITETLFIALVSALPCLCHAWRKQNHTTIVRPIEPFAVIASRIVIKCIGLWGTLLIIGLLYWVFPEYHTPFYLPFWHLISHIYIWFLLLSPVYLYVTDLRMDAPEDGLWHTGKWMIGRHASLDYDSIFAHIRAWLIKAFFFPLMFIYLSHSLNDVMQITLDDWSIGSLYTHASTLLFTIDLLFAVMGYILTLRYFGTHIQSSEPTLLGWVVCLLCYHPFYQKVTSPSYASYDDSISWLTLTEPFPILHTVWCVIIIFCVTVYAFSTIAFGIRFSNLTYRGLISNGPYRFSKHPAYLAKNLSWWLISVPFIAENGDIALAIRNCFMLLGVNMIYFLRARTEEKHLSAYPEYVAYALWMNEHGVLRFLGKRFSFFRYTPPSSQSHHDAE